MNGKPLLAGIHAGDPSAAFEVGARYAEGRGVPVNLEAAAAWFARAAERGLPLAQFRLGSMYEKGQGVKKDLPEARRLYLSAAEKGNAHAMHNIAVLYAEGIDGKPDFTTAAVWFKKAARYGICRQPVQSGGPVCPRDRRRGGSRRVVQMVHAGGPARRRRRGQEARRDRDPARPAGADGGASAAQTWVADPQPEEATTVRAPPGGWDAAAAGTGQAEAAHARADAGGQALDWRMIDLKTGVHFSGSCAEPPAVTVPDK